MLAGHARVARGGASASADALAIEIDGDRIDLLDAATGVSRTTRALGAPAAADFDAQRFAFPDVDDRSAFIRSKHAKIVSHADVRFTPASFPTSVGGVPVPSYLYTYATAAGFSSSSLPGATFDQPYGLFGSPTSLTALHARYESGPGAALGLQQQIVSGDTAYVTASIDAPLRGYAVRTINAYKQLGSKYTLSADGVSTIYGSVGHVGMTAAFGAAGGGLDFFRSSGGASSFTANLRTPDRPLPGGATWRLRGTLGFDAQRGGLLYQLPDSASYSTVWRHGFDLSVASPVVTIPLGATVATTLGASRTWYSFPHHADALTANASASRPLTRTLTLFAGYSGLWTRGRLPQRASGVLSDAARFRCSFPDGTPYFGYSAFSGASTFRTQSARAAVHAGQRVLPALGRSTPRTSRSSERLRAPAVGGARRREVPAVPEHRPGRRARVRLRVGRHALGAALELRDHTVTPALLVAALAAATLFRVVPLACSGDRLAVAGAGVLRLADGVSCAAIVPGRAIAVSLDADNRVTPQKLAGDVLPAAKIPRAAYVIAPAAESDADEIAVRHVDHRRVRPAAHAVGRRHLPQHRAQRLVAVRGAHGPRRRAALPARDQAAPGCARRVPRHARIVRHDRAQRGARAAARARRGRRARRARARRRRRLGRHRLARSANAITRRSTRCGSESISRTPR